MGSIANDNSNTSGFFPIPAMNYRFYPNRPDAVTAEFARAEYQTLLAQLAPAESAELPDQWAQLFHQWNAFAGYVGGEASRINFRFAGNMADTALKERERYFREEVAPVVTEGRHQFMQAFLESRHADAVAEQLGGHMIPVLRNTMEPLDPINTTLRLKEGQVANQYSMMMAVAEVEFNGKAMSLKELGSFMDSPDPELRKQAWLAMRGWVGNNRQTLRQIFAELVEIRHQMGLNLGHPNFVPLGYSGMGRTDYGPAEAATFRESIRTHAVPLRRRLAAEHAARMGAERMRPWDAPYDPELTIPPGAVPVQTQLESAERMFDRISTHLADHLRRMRAEGLIDLEHRHGKRAGAFCTWFSDEGRPAIFCNSTGNADDVRTLIHEMGHAIQHWESGSIQNVLLHSPTADACEIHSLGLEFLTLPFIDEFFTPEHARRFRLGRWRKVVGAMCYRAQVDEFQHWVYENPTATPAEREDAWARIGMLYDSDLDYSGLEEHLGTSWYQLPHIFRSPFYYIDYAIAETAAMQLAIMAEQDHDRAMQTYLHLCRVGGTMGLLDIVSSAGLRSPFDPELMKELMEYAAAQVGV